MAAMVAMVAQIVRSRVSNVKRQGPTATAHACQIRSMPVTRRVRSVRDHVEPRDRGRAVLIPLRSNSASNASRRSRLTRTRIFASSRLGQGPLITRS